MPDAIPSLINTLSIPVSGVAVLLGLGFTTIEVWGSDDHAGTWAEVTVDGTRLPLVDGVSFYTFHDPAGPPTRRYRWRFSANGAQPVSTYSQNVDAETGTLSGVDMSLGVARFMGVTGRAAGKALIIAVEDAQTMNGYTMGSKDTVVMRADATGLLQVPLVQGARIRVAIEGSDIVRTITVPHAPMFDILLAMAEAPDEFTVQEPAPLLTKRNI